MNSLRLDFNGTRVDFSSNLPHYFRYVSDYFEQVAANANASGAADIEVAFDWTERSFNDIMDAIANEPEMMRIGANTFVGPNRVATMRKLERRWKVIFEARQHDHRFILRAYFQRKKFKDFFRFGPLSRPAHEWYFNLSYYLIYYPLFRHLAVCKGQFPLHAAAIDHPQGGIVICGLEGIGKTSLSLKFLEEPAARLLSDNLVFFDRERIYPCYELVRMHAGEKESLWAGRFERIENFNIKKGFYRPTYPPVKEGIRPKILIFPEFSRKFFFEELNCREAADRALSLSYLPAELDNYGEYRNLYNLMLEGDRPDDVQRAHLEHLLREVRILRIGMVRRDGLDSNFNKVKDLIL